MTDERTLEIPFRLEQLRAEALALAAQLHEDLEGASSEIDIGSAFERASRNWVEARLRGAR